MENTNTNGFTTRGTCTQGKGRMLDRSDLHPYQETAVAHIKGHPHCGVFLDMGLGKTVSTLTSIADLMFDHLDSKRVLVIAPKRVAETVWAEETAKWSHLRGLRCSKITGNAKQREAAYGADADVYVMSRDNVVWLYELQGNGKAFAKFDTLVIDELSSFKNPQAKRFKALRKVRTMFDRVVGLTGTPAPNGLMDLWSQIYLIDGGERLGKTLSLYRTRWFTPGWSNGYIVYSYTPRKGAAKEIREALSDICVSMKAEDYLTLPPRTDNFIKVDLGGALEGYRRFERDRVLEIGGEDVTAVNAASLSNKLLQYANGAIYHEDGDTSPVHDAKLEALAEIVEASCGKPLLVAWTYRFDRDRIMERFKDLSPRILDGAEDIADWNAGKVRMLLAHPASAGHGLNLQAGGSIIVWFGLTWSLELYQQFNARLYRQGQCDHVTIHHLVAAGTIDEDVVKALARKDCTQNALLEGIKARINQYVTKN